MNIKNLLKGAIIALIAGGGSFYVAIQFVIPSEKIKEVVIETNPAMELSNEQIPALVETSDGEIEEISVPTVEKIEGTQKVQEDELDFGRGEQINIETPYAFKDAVIGRCWDLDGKHGSQCVDLFNLYQYLYTGRWVSTCGTGAARGIWDCKEYNAGDEYELITDPLALQPGDWAIFDGGLYGHVGMVMGYYNNGYIALLGTNQGGAQCEGGGSAASIINMSLATFRGAFRPKIYIQPEPEPEPIPVSGCIEWHVERGDTMSKIMLECENTVVYGEAMNAYAKTWYSLIYKPGQSVYDGWQSTTGVGLYAGDDIEHRGAK